MLNAQEQAPWIINCNLVSSCSNDCIFVLHTATKHFSVTKSFDVLGSVRKTSNIPRLKEVLSCKRHGTRCGQSPMRALPYSRLHLPYVPGRHWEPVCSLVVWRLAWDAVPKLSWLLKLQWTPAFKLKFQRKSKNFNISGRLQALDQWMGRQKPLSQRKIQDFFQFSERFCCSLQLDSNLASQLARKLHLQR